MGLKIGGEEDVIRHNQRIKSQAIKNTTMTIKLDTGKPRAKYGNKVTVTEEGRFDSLKELNRYEQLKLMEKAGEIKNLERQKKYVLQPSFKFLGKTIREIGYVADYVYEKDGKLVVEDCKSPITRKNPVYKLKKKMMMYVHGIEIKES